MKKRRTITREECPNCGDIMILHTVEDGVYTYRCRNCDREVSTFRPPSKPTKPVPSRPDRKEMSGRRD